MKKFYFIIFLICNKDEENTKNKISSIQHILNNQNT